MDRPAEKAQPFIELNVVSKFDKEVNRFVAGSPELEVWSSGDTAKDALDRAQQAILLFLNEVTEMGTLWDILKEAGIDLHWKHQPASLLERLPYVFRGDFFPIQFPVAEPGSRAGLLIEG